MSLQLTPALERLLNARGPRYTSYPTALLFDEGFSPDVYIESLQQRNAETPLSLYLHIPFCKSLCYYCACSKIITQNEARMARYHTALLREIAWLGRTLKGSRRLAQLHLGGGSPSRLPAAQLGELLTALRDIVNFDDDKTLEAGIEVDPRHVDADDLRAYRELGFNRISFGVQDFDARVQVAVNRVQSRDHVLELIDAARKLGFRGINADLIYGLPLQTPESFDATLQALLGARPDRVAVYSYAHLPSAFRAQRLIPAEQLPDARQKIELFMVAQRALEHAGYRYVGMDHFALPDDELARALDDGSLQRNFQGYSTHARCDVVGLGLSAVSQIGDIYAQNCKSDLGYAARINAGGNAIDKGLRLTPDDRIRRDLIQQLMCRAHLDIAAFEAWHGLRFDEYFERELPELRELASLELLTINLGGIEITVLGRYFLRPICAIFDAYKMPSITHRYSQAA